MTGSPKVIAAAVGGLVLLVQLPAAHGQSVPVPPAVTRVASLASGSIGGVVQDERGAPIAGAMVSALGARTAVAVTDRGGRFEFHTLSPGPYLVRAHVSGYIGSRGQLVEVRASARTASAIALRRANATTTPATSTPKLPVLAAGVGIPVEAVGSSESQTPAIEDPDPVAPVAESSPSPVDDDHSETAWRLRHLRRGILKDVTVPDALLAGGNDQPSGSDIFNPLTSRSAGSSLASAASLFAGVPFTGQVNLLTTGSFDSPKELFTSDNFSRGIAYFSLAAPVSGQADWSMHGALTQGDISSWFIAGAYTTRLPARHRYDLGLSYSTQRYDGGNTAALREVTDGSRNVGAVYGFDTFTLAPELAVTYGARVSRYDYLPTSVLLSPRFEVTLSPSEHFRLNTLVSSHALAPGAEEFLPPMDTGLWLPPQRTFSSIVEGRPLGPERTEHLGVEAERDFGTSTLSLRAFRQRVDDQLITVFGLDVPAAASAQLGHYFVGSSGDVDAAGWGAAFRTTLVSRVHGSVEYSMSRARWSGMGTSDIAHMQLAPSVVRSRPDRLQDLSTSVETNLPETATRILVVCRLTNAGLSSGAERPTYDSRFDVQVHQSLPFMDFSTARWEMLLAVRNTFREASADSSVYDELLVVRPPKRIVGGLTLRF